MTEQLEQFAKELREVRIDGAKVRATLDPIMASEDLSKYIL